MQIKQKKGVLFKKILKPWSEIATIIRSYPRCIKGNTVFRGICGSRRRYPRCRATARLPRLPCPPPHLLPKNSEGPASEKKSALARKRTQVGWRPPRTMTPPALILTAGRRVVFCLLRVKRRQGGAPNAAAEKPADAGFFHSSGVNAAQWRCLVIFWSMVRTSPSGS